jgi:methionyl-tRNA synthetase
MLLLGGGQREDLIGDRDTARRRSHRKSTTASGHPAATVRVVARLYITSVGSVPGMVRADVLARHHRIRGDQVRFLATDAGLRQPLALFCSDTLAVTRDELFRQACDPAHGEWWDAAGWDAVAAYVNSLGAGRRRWWTHSDRRIHFIGPETRQWHEIHWPAMLKAAGMPTPTDIRVHDDVTEDVPLLAEKYGSDAVRWWLLRGGALVPRANKDLANGVGKLVDRIVVMVHRYREGRPPSVAPGRSRVEAACRAVPDKVHEALVAYDFARALDEVRRLVDDANRYIDRSRPWELTGEDLDAALAVLLLVCRTLANQLTPFVPVLATRIAERCFSLSGALPPPRPVFPRMPSTRL